MPGHGDFFSNKKQKKMSKEEMAKKAAKQGFTGGNSWVVPAPTVIPKGKKKNEVDW